MEFVQKLYYELEEQLNFIHLETEDELKKAELSIQVTLKVIDRLKTYIIKYKFHNQNEEIIFFKQLKPKFYHALFTSTGFILLKHISHTEV